MSTFAKALIALGVLAIVFGSLWAAMIFVGLDPDGFKDATIMIIASIVGAVGTKIGINITDNNKK